MIGPHRSLRTGAGLTLVDGPERLTFSADLPQTSASDDVLTLVRTNVLRGASVEMRVTAERVEGGVRIIEKARLSAIGVVDTPAYPQSEIEARRRGGGGGRATWIRGSIKYGVEAFCECLDGDCDDVLFRPKSLGRADNADVLAITGRASEAVGSTRGGTLRLRNGERGLEFSITDAGRATAAGQSLLDQARVGTPLYARPLIDDARSQFKDEGGVRRYDLAWLRALLIKPILGGDERTRGWEPLVIPSGVAKRKNGSDMALKQNLAARRVIGPSFACAAGARSGEWFAHDHSLAMADIAGRACKRSCLSEGSARRFRPLRVMPGWTRSAQPPLRWSRRMRRHAPQSVSKTRLSSAWPDG